MTRGTINLTAEVYAYLLEHSVRETDVLRRLREETAPMPNAEMQISPDQGQFMAFLIRSMQAQRIIELGVFTGYSSLWMALALPENGRLVACDVNEAWTAIARRYWQEAGVSSRIDLRLAPAIQTLDAMIAAGETGAYDFAFIDALKLEYPDYYERVLRLLRPGGVMAIDNVLWDGRVVNRDDDEPLTLAIRDFNARTRTDERVDLCMLAIGDGLTLARKK
jgi:predicted O-methyltransferase YrrM